MNKLVILIAALIVLAVLPTLSLPAQAEGYATGGVKKGVRVTTGGVKKGANVTVGGVKKGVNVTVGGTKKGLKETKKFFKKVF